MRMFNVVAKCGHVGKNNYVLKNFPVIAVNGKEAAYKVRFTPRVKHDQKYAILDVIEIDSKIYYKLKKEQDNDPYFKCKCVQDQRSYSGETIYKEIKINDKKQSKDVIKEQYKIFYLGKKKLRNPKRYLNNYNNYDDYEEKYIC